MGGQANMKSITAVSKRTKCHYVKKDVNSGGTMNGKVFDGLVSNNTVSLRSGLRSLQLFCDRKQSFLKHEK